MRVRGRRLALLLASALPLLADEQDSTSSSAIQQVATGGRGPDVPLVGQEQEDETDTIASVAVAQAIHSHDDQVAPLPDLAKGEEDDNEEVVSKSDATTSANDKESSSTGESSRISDSLQRNETNTDGAATAVSEGDGGTDPEGATVDGSKSPLDSTDPAHASEVTNEEETDSSEMNQTESSAIPRNGSSMENQTLDGDVVGNQTQMGEHEESEDDEEEFSEPVSVDYASKSAGALIIEKASGFKGTSNLLNGDRDKYAIAPCEDKKFVVVSLSEDILVKQVKLANYERFSSSVKEFQILGSQTLGKWFDLGIYTATPGNGEQSFDMNEPAWVRYLKFKFLSHHGVEYYCTYSQIKVHGSNMVQGFHEQWEEDQNPKVADTPGDADGTSKTDEGHGEPSQMGEAENIHDDSADNFSEDGMTDIIYETTIDAAGLAELLPPAMLDDALKGLGGDTILEALYDRGPGTLSSLPLSSREKQERQQIETETKIKIPFGRIATKTISASSRNPGTDKKMLSDISSDDIVAPKMRDQSSEIMEHYSKFDLGVIPGSRAGNASQEDRIEEQEIAPQSESGSQVADYATDTDDEAQSTGVEKKITSADSIQSPMDDERLSEEDPNRPDPASSSNEQTSDSTVADEPDSVKNLDHSLAVMLKNLPSSDCLSTLDFAKFKANVLASRTAGSVPQPPGGSMEPIFKKLTDEIKSLQTTLTIHDQFAISSASCYQRILLDLVVEMDKVKSEQGIRLRRLEEEFQRSQQSVLSLTSVFVASLLSGFWFLVRSVAGIVASIVVTWATISFNLAMALPRLACRGLARNWPWLKESLIARCGPRFTYVLSPVLATLDKLAESSLSDTVLPDDDTDDDPAVWTPPILQTILLILLGRLLMCFAGSTPQAIATRFSSPVRKIRSPPRRDDDVIPELKPEPGPLKIAESSLEQRGASDSTSDSDTPPVVHQ